MLLYYILLQTYYNFKKIFFNTLLYQKYCKKTECKTYVLKFKDYTLVGFDYEQKTLIAQCNFFF